jgi:two-component system, chemotaxis family, sensor kinase CheA
MDLSKYKGEFISEARDSLDSLNKDLVELEKTPNDEEIIHRLFRSFHTLKGNAAAMGYAKFSELAHSLEDVLSKIKDKELSMSSELMSIILEGCDVLEDGLEKIMGDASEDISIERIVQELKEAMGVKEQKIDVTITPKLELTDADRELISQAEGKGLGNIYRIILVFESSNILKTAKTLLVMKLLVKDNSEDVMIIRTTPTIEDIRQGKFGQETEGVVATRRNIEDLTKIIGSITGIKEVYVLKPEEEYARNAAQAHEDKELKKQEIVAKHQEETVRNIQSVKVDMDNLDKLMNLVGELLISNMRLKDVEHKRDLSTLKVVLAEAERQIIDLKDEVMKIRMVPIGNIFNRFPRMVRDLATKENKKVEFIMEGQDIEFDRTILDQIGDPLVHMLRNSVDHGVELPAERLQEGKPEEGTIKLKAFREKNNAVIEVSDDGAGVNPEKVKAACIKKGIITSDEASKMSVKELQMLIFKASISTNEIVTEISGRGVGMEVVSTSMKKLGGTFSMDSVVGKGTTIRLELPLTVAIITSFLVRVGNDIYAIPLNNINETLSIPHSDVKTIKGHKVFILRGREVPIIALSELLGTVHGNESSRNVDESLIVVVNHPSGMVGLVVDDIVSQQQILIKSLQNLVKGTKGCAGATILGDGSIALILDINTLI